MIHFHPTLLHYSSSYLLIFPVSPITLEVPQEQHPVIYNQPLQTDYGRPSPISLTVTNFFLYY